MSNNLILCIPGPWKDRGNFAAAVVDCEPGRYMLSTEHLADLRKEDDVRFDFRPAHPSMREAFQLSGRGKLSKELLDRIDGHLSSVHLYFPLDLVGHSEAVKRYTFLMQRAGGMAIKVNSVALSHPWENWFQFFAEDPTLLYYAAVVRTRDREHYYSCGMHHFGVPDCETPRPLAAGKALELMCMFNIMGIAENPPLKEGDTFRTRGTRHDFPLYRLSHVPDTRNEVTNLFHNPFGIWRLDPVPTERRHWNSPTGWDW